MSNRLSTGTMVAVGGVWVLAQVLRGGALERLGIIDNRTGSAADKRTTTTSPAPDGVEPTPSPPPTSDQHRERVVPTPARPQPAPSPSPRSF